MLSPKKEWEQLEKCVVSSDTSSVSRESRDSRGDRPGPPGGHQGPIGAHLGPLGGHRGELGGPRGDLGGHRGDLGGPRGELGGPRGELGGPRGECPAPLDLASPQPTGTRGNLASQPGTESESLSDMSVRGLDLLKYAFISNDGSYRCIECEKVQILKSFKNKYSFQRHAFLYHEGIARKVFPCPVCAKEFSRPDKMKQHLKQVHDCIIPKSEPTPPSPSDFVLNPFMHLGDPMGMDSKLHMKDTTTNMFKLISQMAGHSVGHPGHLKAPGGQGAS